MSFALGCVALAGALTWLANPYLDRGVFVFLYLAVTLSAWLGGRAAGLVATIASVLLADYFFIPPVYSLQPLELNDVVPLAVFAVIAALTSYLAHSERAARQMAEARERSLREQTMELESQTEEAQTLAEELEQTNLELEHASQVSLEARRDAEQARDEARAHLDVLNGIMSGTSDPIFVKDTSGRYLFANDAATRVFGRPVHEAIGLTDEDLMPPDAARRVQAVDRHVIETGTVSQTEETFHLRGKPSVFLTSKSVLRDNSGEVVGIVGVATDITERHRRLGEQQLLDDATQILSSSLDYQTTVSTLARLVVPQLAEWCGVSLLGENGCIRALGIVHADPDKTKAAADGLREYPLDANAPWGTPLVIRTGQSLLVSELTDEVLTPFTRDEAHLELLRLLGAASLLIVPMTVRGRTLGALTMMRGPTSPRFGAEELRLAEELGRRAALAVDNAQLYQAALAGNEAKGNFLATISHELRTPLTAIIGYEELLADGITGPVTDAQRQQLSRIKASANHLLALIDEILLFARLEAGRESSSPAVLQVRDVLENAYDAMAPLAAAKNIELRTEMPCPLSLRTDARMLHQILLNLLSNAVKFTERGSVTLRVNVEEDHLRFDVEDTGIGIPEEHLAHVFDAFWQVEQRATRPFGGSGLGLTVSQHLARLLGGDISVQSTLGVGTTFSLRLPNGPQA